MGLLSELSSGTASGILRGIGEAAIGIRTAITGEAPIDPDKRAEIEMRLLEIENSARLAQLAVNQAEASSGSLFRGGWRPAVGWVCVFGLVYQLIVCPFLPWFVNAFKTTPLPPLPVLDANVLMTLLFGMLGLAGVRSFEKAKGVGGK